MGKKRKSGQPFGAKFDGPSPQTRFNVNERFDDSEDEFLAGRDRILLDEGPDAKRRRNMREQGINSHYLSSPPLSFAESLIRACRGSSSTLR